MENITNAAEEVLVDALSFKLPGSGQYVQERRSVTFHTEGSNTYQPTSGTRVIRFKLATEGWLDPSTVRVFLDVVNNDESVVVGTATNPPTTKVLRPIGAVHAFFKRLRITMRGVVIEDIMDYNRVHEMFDILSTPQTRQNGRAEGFGDNIPIRNVASPGILPGIKRVQTVCFKPLAGILMQTKVLPLRYCPLEIELELADADDPVITNFAGQTDNSAATTSIQWKLESCMLKADLCTLDNALDNNYTSHLMGGKELNIVYNTFISNIQTIVSADTQINVSRSLTRLRSVFLSLQRDLTLDRARFYNKGWNNFYSPMAADTNTLITTHREANEITYLQLQVGAFMIPQYPIRSHAECYYSLRKSLGIQASGLHSIDIDGNEYRNNKFIVGLDCEKLLNLAFTGMNTKNSLMTIKLKTAENNMGNRMHILLTAEQILTISDAGITVFD
jgi:hypothetical protein